MSSNKEIRIGVDIGGTFTDIVMVGEGGSVFVRKVSSTPDDYGRGILQGLSEIIDDVGAFPSQIDSIVHATTVATNAVLEGKGAKTGLITTRGFRDVLEMRRIRIPDMYNLDYVKPRPLVERRLRREIAERIGPNGDVWEPLDEKSVQEAGLFLKNEGVESVAISLMHSYVNPAHEIRVLEILKNELSDDVFISCSHEILPEIREYERTSTTVVNALLGPVVSQYLSTLAIKLESLGISKPLQIMQSNGGLMSAVRASKSPAKILESGPAAGVIAAAKVAALSDVTDLITLDMGGTTAKTAIVEGGQPAKTTEYEVGSGINLSSRLLRGAGYAVKLPFIDVSEIGAGGGSKVWFDDGNLIHVGPQRAGSVPGPVCYNNGGQDVTLTDALVTLGYLNPDYLVGGSVTIDSKLSTKAINDYVCPILGLDCLKAAHGIYTIATSNMIRAVKAVSTFRGRDPREFSLFAFGGNGPVVSMEIARELEMPRLLIPPSPGVFSAFGLLLSETEHESLQTLFGQLDKMTVTDILSAYDALQAKMVSTLIEDGHNPKNMIAERYADLRYAHQAFEITVPIDQGILDKRSVEKMKKLFNTEHERIYGHKSENASVEIVNIRVKMSERNKSSSINLNNLMEPNFDNRKTQSDRKAYFGPDFGVLDTPVLGRRDIFLKPMSGPLIIEEYDSTCLVLPGYSASVDENAIIDIRVEQ